MSVHGGLLSGGGLLSSDGKRGFVGVLLRAERRHVADDEEHPNLLLRHRVPFLS